MHMPELDDLDLSILTLTKHNARMSYSEIGNRVGLSRVAVKNCIPWKWMVLKMSRGI